MDTETASARQRAHYDQILDEYDAHYGDALSREYRRRFFLSPLLDGLDLNDCDVADLAAGSGHTTLDLQAKFPRVRPVGFDVSDLAVQTYASRTRCEAHVWDLTGEAAWTQRFDVAIVVGGLHHCATALDTVLRNVADLLRPGGLFLMIEPNRDTWLEPLRQIWYRRDRYFESSTEAALSHDELLARGRGWFEAVSVRYMGGPAYFLVYNSLVFRLPLPLKRAAAGPLMSLEEFTNRLPWRGAYPYFIARWRRRGNPALSPLEPKSLLARPGGCGSTWLAHSDVSTECLVTRLEGHGQVVS
jgi:SAM-dependent methyltransferase